MRSGSLEITKRTWNICYISRFLPFMQEIMTDIRYNISRIFNVHAVIVIDLVTKHIGELRTQRKTFVFNQAGKSAKMFGIKSSDYHLIIRIVNRCGSLTI